MTKYEFKQLMGIRTDAELARYFGIDNRQTVHQWKQIPPGYILDLYIKDRQTFDRIMEGRA